MKDGSGRRRQRPDPATSADTAWTDKVLPAVETKAVDAPELLAAIEEDPAAAAEKYGVVAAAGGTPSFAIKGAGR